MLRIPLRLAAAFTLLAATAGAGSLPSPNFSGVTATVFTPLHAALRAPAATDDATMGMVVPGSIASLTAMSYGAGITSGSCSVAAPTGTPSRQATCHIWVAQGVAVPVLDDPGEGYSINTYPAVTIADNGTTHAAASASVALLPSLWVGPNGMHQAVSNIPGQGTWQPLPSPGYGIVDAIGVQPLVAYGSTLQNRQYAGPGVNVQAGAAAQDVGFVNGHLDYASLDAFAAANLNPTTPLFLPLAVTLGSGGSGCTTGIAAINGGSSTTPLYLSITANAGVVTAANLYPAASPAAYTAEPSNPVSVSQTGCTATFHLTWWNNGFHSYPTVNTAYDQSTSYIATGVTVASSGAGSGCVSFPTEGVLGTSQPISTVQLALTASGGGIASASIVSPGQYGGAPPPNPVALNPNHEPGCTALLNMTWARQNNASNAVAGWMATNQAMAVVPGHAGTTCGTGTFAVSGGNLGVGGTPMTVALTVAGGAVTGVSQVFPGVYLGVPPNPVAVPGCDAQITVAGWQSTGPSISSRNTIGKDRSLVFDSNEAILSGGPTTRKMLFLPTGPNISPRAHGLFMVARVMAADRAQSWVQIGPDSAQTAFGINQNQQTFLQSGTATTLASFLPSQSPQFLAYVESGNAGVYDDDAFAQAPGPTGSGTVNGGTIGYSDYINAQGGAFPGGGGIFEWTAFVLTSGSAQIASQLAAKQAAYAQASIQPQITELEIDDGASNVEGHDAILADSTPRQTEPLLHRPGRHFDTAWSGATMQSMAAWFPTHVAPVLQAAHGGRAVCYLSPGNNDLSTGVPATTVEGYIAAYVAEARSAGCTQIVLATNFPNSNHILPNSPAGVVTEWAALNAWILANSVGADAVADEGGDAVMGNPANTVNQTYFAPDGAHASDLGQSFLARIDAAAINGLQ